MVARKMEYNYGPKMNKWALFEMFLNIQGNDPVVFICKALHILLALL